MAVAFSQRATTDFDAIDRYVAAKVRASGVPGFALAIVQGDQVRHLRGFGVADSSGRLVTPQTPFILGSTSKSFTALAVLQLVEGRRLDLDAPVRRYLPWFQVADSTASATITIRQLLHHTSGLSTSTGDQPMRSGDDGDLALENGVRALRTSRRALFLLWSPDRRAALRLSAEFPPIGLPVGQRRGHGPLPRSPYEWRTRWQSERPLASGHRHPPSPGDTHVRGSPGQLRHGLGDPDDE